MKILLTIISLAVALCFTISCRRTVAIPELEQFKAQAKVEEQNIETAKNFIETWGSYDAEAIKAILDPDFLYYLPSLSATPLSVEEILEMNQVIQNAFPDMERTVSESYASGNKAILRLSIKATHTGEYQGIQPTGNIVEFGTIAIFTIRNGKTVELREEADLLGFMQQLGMELKPKEETGSAIKPPSLLEMK